MTRNCLFQSSLILFYIFILFTSQSALSGSSGSKATNLKCGVNSPHIEIDDVIKMIDQVSCKNKLAIFDIDDTILTTLLPGSVIPIRNSPTYWEKLEKHRFTTLGLTARAALLFDESIWPQPTIMNKYYKICENYKKNHRAKDFILKKDQLETYKALNSALKSAKASEAFTFNLTHKNPYFFYSSHPPKLELADQDDTFLRIKSCEDMKGMLSFSNGVLSVSGQNKGRVFQAFLDYLKKSNPHELLDYDCIFFADDSAINIKNMIQTFKKSKGVHLFVLKVNTPDETAEECEVLKHILPK